MSLADDQELRAAEFGRKIDHYLRTAAAADVAGDELGAKHLRNAAEGYKATERGLLAQARRLRDGLVDASKRVS